MPNQIEHAVGLSKNPAPACRKRLSPMRKLTAALLHDGRLPQE